MNKSKKNILNKIKRNMTALIMFFAVISISGCVTVPSDEVFPGSSNELYLKELCRRHDINWDWDQISQVVTLSKGFKTATAMMDSPVVLMDDQQIVLNEPLQLRTGAIVVSRDFKEQVISRMDDSDFTYADQTFIEDSAIETVPIENTIVDPPVARSTYTPSPAPEVRDYPKKRGSYKLHKLTRVIIDAGHGGKDPGAIGKSGTNEKVVTLDIARRLSKILEAQGVRVQLTRSDDKFISLQERTAIAGRAKADAFISIHANSSPTRSVTGVEVFALRNLSADEQRDEKRRNNRNIMMKHLSSHSHDHNVGVVIDDMLSGHKKTQSLRLAKKMSSDLSRSLRTKNRGAKTAGFYVLRNTFIPAVLIEVGFLSNPKEERNLKSKKYRDKVARTIAKSLLDFSKED